MCVPGSDCAPLFKFSEASFAPYFLSETQIGGWLRDWDVWVRSEVVSVREPMRDVLKISRKVPQWLICHIMALVWDRMVSFMNLSRTGPWNVNRGGGKSCWWGRPSGQVRSIREVDTPEAHRRGHPGQDFCVSETRVAGDMEISESTQASVLHGWLHSLVNWRSHYCFI